MIRLFRRNPLQSIAIVAIGLALPGVQAVGDEFQRSVMPLITAYCVDCHSDDDPSGEINFEAIGSERVARDVFEQLESAVEHLQSGTMPPPDEDQPTDVEREQFYRWYEQFTAAVVARPAIHRPRRLSAREYRNALQSVLGFELQVAIAQAEQTVAERSLVLKLLPTDPPGRSGFTNDTRNNALTTNAWDQYSRLADTGVERLFSLDQQSALNRLVGRGPGSSAGASQPLSASESTVLVNRIAQRAWRRPASRLELPDTEHFKNLGSEALDQAVRVEIKSILMSPRFLYRGLLLERASGATGQQRVDPFELAERISFFLWGDMPDATLWRLAAENSLQREDVLRSQVSRMLASPKAVYLTEAFATEWFTLNEIDLVSDDVPKVVALKTQVTDFTNYLFTSDRPIVELLDSEVTFINPHTSRYYGADGKQLTRYVKQKGIEREIVPNEKIQLVTAGYRGGIMTMPGILTMNRGPILRGTWLLERILGDELPDPPANVGQVAPNANGENLSFRERFEQHRRSETCALCHDKIDPLGFTFGSFDDSGRYHKAAAGGSPGKEPAQIDTSGRLPSGEEFRDHTELKKILLSEKRQVVIRNIVNRTLSFALCRKLTIYDRPVVDKLTEEMSPPGRTWRDLFCAVALSLPFQQTILSSEESL